MDRSIVSRPQAFGQGVHVEPSNVPLGAEINGLQISEGLSPQQFEPVRNALHRYKVVVLRNQNITPAQQISFSAHLGNLEPHVLPQFLVPGYKELVRVSNVLDEEGKPVGLVDAGRIWHTDGHFLERPNMYSMLYALEIPHDAAGKPLGATRFASTAYAYTLLPPAMRAKVADLRAANSLAAVYKSMHGANAGKTRPPLTDEQKREVVHPVIRTHPVTGEKCIYVTRAATTRILGLDEQESQDLIGYLSDLCVRDENVYKHQWQVGDVLIWDNCSSQHMAIGDYELPQRRMLQRTTISGELPF